MTPVASRAGVRAIHITWACLILAAILIVYRAASQSITWDEAYTYQAFLSGYLPFERRNAHLFFQLFARRYERASTLITTNQLVTHWGTVFGDEVLAAAILDRLLHHSYTLMIQGESYRLRQKKKASLIAQSPKREA